MPRKNARPAAKKLAARKRTAMKMKAERPRPGHQARAGVIRRPGTAPLALAALAAGIFKDHDSP